MLLKRSSISPSEHTFFGLARPPTQLKKLCYKVHPKSSNVITVDINDQLTINDAKTDILSRQLEQVKNRPSTRPKSSQCTNVDYEPRHDYKESRRSKTQLLLT